MCECVCVHMREFVFMCIYVHLEDTHSKIHVENKETDTPTYTEQDMITHLPLLPKYIRE